MELQPALVGPEVEPGRPVDEKTLSQRWLGLDWRDHLPWKVGDVTIEHGTFDDALEFVERWYPSIFGRDDSRWFQEPMTGPKRRFMRETDCFLFKDGDSVVGMHLSHPSDWTTYYIRSLALLPEYRGCGVLAVFAQRMIGVLVHHGIRRLEGETALANAANIITWMRQGAVVTGMVATDRWGTMVRLTKYLDDEAGEVFLDQFVAGTWPQCRQGMSTGPGRRSS